MDLAIDCYFGLYWSDDGKRSDCAQIVCEVIYSNQSMDRGYYYLLRLLTSRVNEKIMLDEFVVGCHCVLVVTAYVPNVQYPCGCKHVGLSRKGGRFNEEKGENVSIFRFSVYP